MPVSIVTEKDINELNDTDVTASINRYSIFNPSLQSFEDRAEITECEETSEKKACCKGCKAYMGLCLAFVSSFLAALSGVLIRVLSFSLNPAEIFTIRSAVQTIIMLPLILSVRHKIEIKKKEGFLLLLLCVLDSFGSLSTHYAISMIAVAEASVIINCRHIFTLPLAKFWLKENVGLYDILVVIVSIGGLVMTCQPPALFGGAAAAFTTTRMLGIICAFGSAVFNSTAKCINRRLQDIHLYLIIFLPALTSTIVGSVVMLIRDEIQNPFAVKNSYVMLIIIVMSISSNTCQSAASQLAMAVNVAIIMTMRLPFSVVLEFLVIGTWPNIFSVIGLGLSSLSILLLAMKKPFLKRMFDGDATEKEKLIKGEKC